MARWRRRIAVGVLGTGLVLGTSVAALAKTSLVTNGDFERPDAGQSWVTFQVGERFGHWTVTKGSIDVIGAYWHAASGKQSVELNGVEQGAVSQLIPTVPGQSYVLQFALSGEPINDACGPIDDLDMQVRFAGALVGRFTFDTTGHDWQHMGWETKTIDVTAAKSYTRLKFRSLEIGCSGPAIDSIRLRPAADQP